MTYTTYSASQAVARANAQTSWPTARCLEFVMHCVNGEQVGLYDANEAWAAARQRETAGTPPAGAPVYFSGYTHGHIAVSLGGGRIRSTDEPSLGRVANTTIGDIERDWGIKYRGWSRDYAGLIIRGLEETSTVNSGTPPPLPITPSPSEEDDMPTAEEIAQAVWAVTVSRNGQQINALQELADAKTAALAAPEKVWTRTVARGGANVPAIQELADAKTAALVAANATAILSRLDSLLTALPGLPDDADVAALKAQLAELKTLVAALPKA